MYVTPSYQSRLLENTESGNFALVFSRMTPWNLSGSELKSEFQSGTRQTRNGPVPVYDSAIVQLGQLGNNILPHAAFALQQAHQRQKRLLEQAHDMDAFALEIRARLTSPFVSGLGSGHPTETGMILDRNTGIPFIPASTVKGLLRLAHAINLLRSGYAQRWVRNGLVDAKGKFRPDPNGNHLDLDDREPSLRKYFGDTDTSASDGVRGQLVFLDVFPETPPVLKADIMNPHFHKYYGENMPPVDCEDPIPVKFLAVKEGAVFIFRVLSASLGAPKPELECKDADPVERSLGSEDEQRVRDMFSVAFEELGFGAKTAVGYGRFRWIESGQDQSVKENVDAPSAESFVATSASNTDPRAERRATLEAFKNALPRADALAGQIDNLIQTVQAKEDAETRQLCCQSLLDLAQSNKKAFKKALKESKPWVVKLTKLCEEMGLEMKKS